MRHVLVVILLVLSVTMTGSGTVGEIKGGWSVSCDATPLAPGDTNGGVGAASVDAERTATSVFATDNDAVLNDTTAGTWRGNVVASPVAGENAHLDVLGKLNFLVADRTVDPGNPFYGEALRFGNVGSALSQFANVYDIAIDPYDNGIFVSSFGTLAYSFPSVGLDRYDVIKYDSTGKFVWSFQTNSSFVSDNGNFGGRPTIAVNPVNGQVAIGDNGFTRIQVFTPNGDHTRYTFAASTAATDSPGTPGTGNGQFASSSQPIVVAYDSTGALYASDAGNDRIQKFTISGATFTYVTKVAVSGFVAGAGIADMVMSPNDILHVSLTTSTARGAVGTIRTYNTSLVAQNTATITAPAGSGSGILTLSVDATGVWAYWGYTAYLQRYTLSGATATEGIRWSSGFPIGTTLASAVASATDTSGRVDVLFRLTFTDTFVPNKVTSFRWIDYRLSDAIYNYMLSCDSTLGGLSYSFDATSNPYVVLPAWSGDVWAHIKEILTAHNLDLYLDDSTIRVADAGVRTIELTNTSPVRTEPVNRFGGQELIMYATNATAGGGTVWSAAESNTRYQIDVGQRRTVSVSTNNYPVTVDDVIPADALPILPGQYYVIDSTGIHVPSPVWVAAGASVLTEVGDQVGQVKFILQGPNSAISGYTGPFTFADGNGTTAMGALTVTGTGVFTSPQSVTFQTGANPTKTTQQVARTIRNFAIDTLDRLYQRAPMAIDEVSGVAMSVSFTVPTADLLGFGSTMGATFMYNDSRYRITNATFGALTTQITATRYVSIDMIDTATAGLTIDQRDAIWTGYSIDDRTIKPLALTV